MRKQKLRDWIRRGCILLLLASALLLLRNTGYYAGFREMLLGQSERSERTETSGGAAPQADVSVLPVAVTVRGPDGGARYGAAYDGENTSAVLRRFSVDLGEALGSADDPAELNEADCRAKMNGCCVCFHFACPLPLNLLSGWLGTEMSGGAAADSAVTVCLCASETETTLCYRTPEGLYFNCATAAKPDALRARTAEFPPNGALYAWESDRLEGGETLLLQEAPHPAVVKSAVALPNGEETNALLQTMGMNSFVASSYSEVDGTTVFIHEETSLRISPTGTASFRRAASLNERGGTMSEAVNAAWQTAERTIGIDCGDGGLLFAGVSFSEAQETYTVLLDYVVDGIPVRLASGHAAEIVLHGDTVIQARLQFRRFTRTEEQTVLLPYLQAAAIAAAQQAEPELIYADAGNDTVCMWVIADG